MNCKLILWCSSGVSNPNGHRYSICKNNDWEFIATFKDGNLPTVWNIIEEELEENSSNNNRTINFIEEGQEINQDYIWVNGVKYKEFKLNWIECFEKKTNKSDGKFTEKYFVHVTSLGIEYDTAHLISRGGRLRWKIENEGFNTQKNQGYGLGRKYSRTSLLALKNYYQCIQIGHLINQLMILSNLFQKRLIKKITIKHLWESMIGFITQTDIDSNILKTLRGIKIQIRFT